jgi:3-oxoacyl-[acyl-carrier protein] reductase
MLRDGTRILITGSSRGIGAAIARLAGKSSAKVAVNYKTDHERALSTADGVRHAGGEAIVVRADVRDAVQVKGMLREVDEAFGGVDILINNAHSPFEPTLFESLTWPAIEQQISGTVLTCFNCTQAALPYLRHGNTPSILNISSVTVRQPVPGFCHRNLAKAAVEGMTRSLALELSAFGIRVNALSVGWTATDQLGAMPPALVNDALKVIPMSRLATPEEIASTALFLVSTAASYINGTVFPVAGGLCPDPIFPTGAAP